MKKWIFAFALLGLPAIAWAQCAPGIPGAGNPGCIPPNQTNSPYYQGGGNQDGYGAPAQQEDTWVSVVTHPDTEKVWITKGYPGTLGIADSIKECTKAMGEGCGMAASWSNNSHISVVADTAGNLFAKGAPGGIKAWWQAKDACKQVSDGCHEVEGANNVVSGPTYFFPDPPFDRRIFGAVARIKGTPPEKFSNTVWVSAGKQGFVAAQTAALSTCHSDSGMACVIDITVGNGLIGQTIDNENDVYWINIGDPKATDKQVKNNCPKNRQCRLVNTIDVRTPRDGQWSISAGGASPKDS